MVKLERTNEQKLGRTREKGKSSKFEVQTKFLEAIMLRVGYKCHTHLWIQEYDLKILNLKMLEYGTSSRVIIWKHKHIVIFLYFKSIN